MRGLKPEQLEEEMKALQANSEDQAKEQMKLFFIMDKIAEKLGVEVSDEEINGHIAQVAAQKGKRPEKMREELARDGSLAQFTLQVREQKCVEKLLESAKITEVAADKAKKKTAKKKTAKKKTAAKKATKKDDAEKKPAAKKKTAKKKTTKKKE
jgi:trigger factor